MLNVNLHLLKCTILLRCMDMTHYTDNPTADKHFLESIFPSLTKTIISVELYPTLDPFMIPPDVCISAHSTVISINEACTRIKDDLDVDDNSICLECGLDAEWNVNMTHGGGPEPTSIIQIAYKKWVDVFQVRIPGEFCFACILTFLQIGHFKGGPNCLQSFLSNPHILKSGHNVTQDLKWLEKEYNSP